MIKHKTLHNRDFAFQGIHNDAGHQGRDKTLWLAKQRFFRNGMEREIKDRVETCGRCIRRKTTEIPRANLENIKSTKPLEIRCIDFYNFRKVKRRF